MKKLIFIITAAIFLISSCKKESGDQKADPNQPVTNLPSGTATTMLSAVINQVKDDPNKGSPVLSAFYKGRQLSMVVGYAYTSRYKGAWQQTHVFNYNSNGQLIGTDVKYVNPSDYNGPLSPAIHTDITFSGNNITNINFSNPNNPNIPGIEIKFSYSADGKLIRINRNDEIYNISNNNNYDRITSILNGVPYIATYSFDTHKNILETLPYWQYFYCFDMLNTSSFNSKSVVIYNGIFQLIPNTNNTISLSTDKGNVTTYRYEYGTNNYPSSSTVSYSGISEDFSYQYIAVN